MPQCCICAGCEDYFIMCSKCIDFKFKEEEEKTPVGQTLSEDGDKPPCYLCYLCGEICRCWKRHLEATGFIKYLKWGLEIIEILMPPSQHGGISWGILVYGRRIGDLVQDTQQDILNNLRGILWALSLPDLRSYKIAMRSSSGVPLGQNVTSCPHLLHIWAIFPPLFKTRPTIGTC